MHRDHLVICKISGDREEPLSKEIELASILSDVVLKGHSDKKLLFLRDTPEKISFISKLYFPFKIVRLENFSFILGTSFFRRRIRDNELDRDKIENCITETLNGSSSPKNLRKLHELFDNESVLDKIKGNLKNEFYFYGGYPEMYPNSFLDEFWFIRNVFTLLCRDGIIFHQYIPDNSLDNSAAKIKSKLDNIESDIKYIKEKKIIISDLRKKLEKKYDETDKEFQKLHSAVVDECNTKALKVSMNITQAISAIEKEFDDSIRVFSKFYPLLEQGLANPTEFHGPIMTTDMHPYQKHDREYQVKAENLLNKIVTCRCTANNLQPYGGAPTQILNFINEVCIKADYTEKQVKKQLQFANNEFNNIWAKEEKLRLDWNSELKENENKIKFVAKEEKEILRKLDNLLNKKTSTVNEIRINLTLPDGFLAESIHIPFWAACLSREDEYRFFVYAPMIKKQNKKWINAFQGFTMPSEPYSKGVDKLRLEIENSLRNDKKLAENVLFEGHKYNMLIKSKECIKKGLETLSNEGWITQGHLKAVLNALSKD